MLPEDVVARIGIEMETYAVEASRILDGVFKRVPEPARVVRCVLYLAEGDVGRLEELARHAQADYVIFWAEYTDHDRPLPRQVRDFTKPFERQKIGLPSRPTARRRRTITGSVPTSAAAMRAT